MTWRRITIILMAVSTLILSVYDAYVAFYTPERGDTISEVLGSWAVLLPPVAFIFGVLMGHWFWSRRRSLVEQPWGFTILVAFAGLGFAAYGVYYRDPVWWQPMLNLALGVTGGHFLWPMPFKDLKS